MLKTKTILFLPSNKNHVLLFSSIYESLKDKSNVLFLTQGSFKDEGVEKTLKELNYEFVRLDDFALDPNLILTKNNVGVLVIGNDSDVIPQWFSNKANKMRISTVLIQDGLMFHVDTIKKDFKSKIFSIVNNPSKKLLFLRLKLGKSGEYKKISYGEGMCTQIHVWGKISKNYFLKKGLDEKMIKVIGNPKMDITQTHNLQKNSSNQTFTILYSPTALVEIGVINKTDKANQIRNLCDVTKSLDNVKLIIKPHPAENQKIYDITKNFNSHIEFLYSDFTLILDRSDLLITDLSTTSIEALSAGKPVIIYLPNLERIIPHPMFPHDLISKKTVLYAFDRKTLLEEITKVMTKKYLFPKNDVDLVLEEYLGPQDRKASQRSSNLIINLLEK